MAPAGSALEQMLRMPKPTALDLASDRRPRPSADTSHQAGKAGQAVQTLVTKELCTRALQNELAACGASGSFWQLVGSFPAALCAHLARRYGQQTKVVVWKVWVGTAAASEEIHQEKERHLNEHHHEHSNSGRSDEQPLVGHDEDRPIVVPGLERN